MRPFRCLLLAAVAALAAAPGAQAAPRDAFGVAVAKPLEVSDDALRRDLVEARRLGAKVVRYELDWGKIEPTPGQISDAALLDLDRAFGMARGRGIKVLGIFLGTPCWASTAPRGEDCWRFPPQRSEQAIGAATRIARRYANDLAAFEVWNEPDHRNEKYWAGEPKVPRYVDLVKTLYGPLKQAAPRVPVLAGAFVGGNGAWLNAMYGEGVKGHYDAMSVHFYDLTLASLRRTREVMRAAGDGAPVWIGETGWSSCAYRARVQEGHQCVTRAAQARQTADLVRALRRTSWVRGVVFYALRDEPGFDFGFFDRRGRAKPVARAFRAEVRARRTRGTRRMAIRATRTRRGVLLRGIAPGADQLEVLATTARYRYRGYTRLDRNGRVTFTLPRVLGTRGITIRVTHPWTGRRTTKRL